MKKNTVTCVVCGGVHAKQLTEHFIEQIFPSSSDTTSILVFPTEKYPAWSSFHLGQFLKTNLAKDRQTLVFISFSAGVVGAMGAAWAWQQQGGKVAAFFALDGWGVPLWGSFPIYRLSHDYFTHWSSALLGGGDENFYASTPVSHLKLWASPQTVTGYWETQSNFNCCLSPTTAALFLVNLLKRHNVFISSIDENIVG